LLCLRAPAYPSAGSPPAPRRLTQVPAAGPRRAAPAFEGADGRDVGFRMAAARTGALVSSFPGSKRVQQARRCVGRSG
jgi:hypothetical protein